MLGRHDAIEEISVQVGGNDLPARLGVPQGPVGVVVFAGKRERLVAEALRARGLATLEVEVVLTEGERYDVELLAERLIAVIDWIEHSNISHLPIGFFAVRPAVAPTLVAASRRPALVRAIAVRDGHPDLAGAALPIVRAPTLFVASAHDEHGIERARAAIEQMTAGTQLVILPASTYTDVDEIVQLAAEWLVDHFARALGEPAARRGSWGRQFRDRRHAGQRLAELLRHHAGASTIVFGLARGGVVVADEVAHALGAPLDVWLVRKIGMPTQPELGMGALAEGAALVLDPTIVRWSGATPAELRAIVHRKAEEIRNRAQAYRGDAPPLDCHGKTVILVDDGIATGGTLRAAIRGARKRGAARVVVASPVASAEAVASLQREADELVCVSTPRHLMAVGAWYQDFRHPPEQDVIAILAAARNDGKARAGA